MSEQSLQERYAPRNACFGCGPMNEKGLRIRSLPRGAEVTCEWQPEKHHEAFPGVLCGGIIGTLMDCHSNWTAIWHLIERDGLANAPCMVTADYAIKLKRPTPTDAPIKIVARVVESRDDRATVEAELISHEKICATCRGTFVAVKPDHPAYNRW